jgi:glycosyltransferase involved in cell wall biosynthesis
MRQIKRAIRAVMIPMGFRIGCFRQHRPVPLTVTPQPEPGADESLPSIAIVTPSLDQGRFLEGAIRSVVEQAYPSLEYVICDGGSTDESAAVIDRWSDRLTASRTGPDNGQADAINRGFGLCSGEIMAWLNADDRLLPGSLLAVGRFLREHRDVDVVYGHRLVLDESGSVVGRWVLPPHRASAHRWRDFVPQETLFWRRSLWDRSGGRVDDSLAFAIDWELLLRFDAAGARFERLPYFLGAFTTHAAQKSVARFDQDGIPEITRIRRQLAPTFGRRQIERARAAVYMVESAAWDWAHMISRDTLMPSRVRPGDESC